MPGLIVHVGAQMQCPHGGTITIAPTQTRSVATLQALATSSSQLTVAGCPFQVPIGTGTKPQPCVTVKWANVATRVRAMGVFVILQATPAGSGAGVCQSAEQIPQGAPIVVKVQERVFAT